MSQADLTRDWVTNLILDLPQFLSEEKFLLSFVEKSGIGFEKAFDPRLTSASTRRIFREALFHALGYREALDESSKTQAGVTNHWTSEAMGKIEENVDMLRNTLSLWQLEELVNFFGRRIQDHQIQHGGNVAGEAVRNAILDAIEAVFFGSNYIFTYRE